MVCGEQADGNGLLFSHHMPLGIGYGFLVLLIPYLLLFGIGCRLFVSAFFCCFFPTLWYAITIGILLLAWGIGLRDQIMREISGWFTLLEIEGDDDLPGRCVSPGSAAFPGMLPL